MRLQFLGTAASEGYPDAFCDCAGCRSAREAGGRSLRKRSSALVDGELLIDLGPDLMAAAQVHGLSLAGVRYCIQTHEHADHLDPTNFLHRSAFSAAEGAGKLAYFASRGALDKVAAGLGRRAPNGLPDPAAEAAFDVSVHVIEPFQTFEVGPYRVTSVRANHDPERLVAMLFVVERGGRVLFYATDTGELPEETWRALADGGHRFDVVALDHTFGFAAPRAGHLNAEQFAGQLDRMRALRLLNDGARVYAHHIAHHSHPTHDELVARVRPRGYEPAYDGLVVEV